MDVKIRDARFDDLDALTALLGELFFIEADFTVDEQRQRRGLRLMLDGCSKHRCIKAAEVAGQVVGMCAAQILISTAEGALSALVEDLVVTESMRRQGIGTRLLAAVEKWARQHGATRLQLLADKTNRPALSFYQTHHWLTTRMICLRKTDSLA